MLSKGIGITGNHKHFFIRGRLETVIQSLDYKPLHILDFGCGIGDTALELSQCFPEATIVGTDVSSPAIRFAASRFSDPNLSFVEASQLPATPSYDFIYVNCVLHHVSPTKRQIIVNQLFDLLLPGGTMWIFENNPANPGTQLAMYTNPFDKGVVKVWPAQLKALINKAGLHLLDTRFLFFFPQWLSWFRAIEPVLLHFPLGGQYGIWARKPIHSKP